MGSHKYKAVQTSLQAHSGIIFAVQLHYDKD